MNVTRIERKTKKLFSGKVPKVFKDDPNAIVYKNFEKVFMAIPLVKCACPMNPHDLNERLILQQGIFMCPGDVSASFEDNLSNVVSSKKDIRKYTIPNDLKIRKKFIQYLHRMNMNSATLFPGMDGFAKSMHALLAFGNLEAFLPVPSEYIKKHTYGKCREASVNLKKKAK